ncbi:hypothetical protein [Streptomyces sp. NPDC096030]|uniref:hypothetical protein n=1 Tax=Streptomyces sp. NPDC096030 TaxID=3155423 RepID=UPI00332321BC
MKAATGIQQRLAGRELAPGEHCLDSGCPSAGLVTAAGFAPVTASVWSQRGALPAVPGCWPWWSVR